VTYISYNINCNGTHSRCNIYPQMIKHIKYNIKRKNVFFKAKFPSGNVVICIPYNVNHNVFCSMRIFFLDML